MSGERIGDDSTILIVEDENIVALATRHSLEESGYRVCSIVSKGEAAIAEAIAEAPDLVLMDILLNGEMDGIEAARRIRESADTPIVFVTAFTDDATLERVKGTGAYGYIVKPYHDREFRITIELALAKHKQEKELLAAMKRAEKSGMAKTRFLSNISHELKTPLNVIIGFIDLAYGIAGSDELKEFLTFAARGSRRLETIIDSILDYTKLEYGELVPFNDEFELDQFLLNCWDPFVYDAYSKGLAIRLYIDPGLPTVIRGDEGKLGTLVRNLLDNSVKFTDSGHILLSAELSEAPGGGPELSITVSDTGPGIPEDKRQYLFRAFTQGDESSTRAFGGLGLGLSLTKEFAMLLDAKLEYTSTPGVGSEFVLGMALDSGVLPAYPAKAATTIRTVGLFGDIMAEPELRRWAPHLGIRLVRLSADSVDPTGCGAIVADAASWSKPDCALRGSAFAREERRVVLIDAPNSREWASDRQSNAKLPCPPSLGTLSRALDYAFGVGGKNVEPPRARRVKANAPGIHDYSRLFNEARSEADIKGLGADLSRMIEYMYNESTEGKGSSVERVVKRYHDQFSDAGAVACAKLALAISIDDRNGFDKPIIEALASMTIRRD